MKKKQLELMRQFIQRLAFLHDEDILTDRIEGQYVKLIEADPIQRSARQLLDELDAGGEGTAKE